MSAGPDRDDGGLRAAIEPRYKPEPLDVSPELGSMDLECPEGLTELFACSDVPLTAIVQCCCHTNANTGSAQQGAVLMLQLARNNKLAATVVALLVSVSAAGMSVTTARGASEHPPVIAVAVLPEAARLQRKRRYAAVRVIRRRLVRRARENKVWSRRRRLNLRPRLPVHEWYARGPPR